MGWKSSKSHNSKSMGGKRHYDVYHVDSNGKRDQSKRTDMKISGDRNKPSITDIHKPRS